jgi:hypothetical protein
MTPVLWAIAAGYTSNRKMLNARSHS